MKIGKAIRELRKIKALKQEDLAKVSGISRTSLSQIEGGVTQPNASTISGICKGLKISEAALLLYSLEENDLSLRNQTKYEAIYPIIRELIEDEARSE